MINIIRGEFQKSKRTSTNKFIVITPLIAILLSFTWGGGQNGAYNWWYTMFLPGMLTIISAQVITREKSLSYKGVFLYPQDKSIIWMGKIAYVIILLTISSLIFMVGIQGFGLISESTIPLKANIIATIILILTSIFMIPVSMFLTVKLNMFVSILFNLAMTIVGVVIFDTNSILNFLPYRISSALMVPVLGILPNGLPVTETSQLFNTDIIINDTISTFIIFLILTILTGVWFRKKEAN